MRLRECEHPPDFTELLLSIEPMLKRNVITGQLNPTDGETVAVGSTAGTGPLTQARSGTASALRKIFSFHAFLAALLLGGAFAVTFTNVHEALSPSSQPLRWLESDTLWHVAVGDLILKTHVWPTHDIFSFTAHGSPWIAY